ncbi:hypothetical protein DY000_02008289 [Brassica cretica]|uniref:Uncharacterized protein n=1 Tax=Brassica cretica TaxID=69181 RepID=A0ABQ7CBF3_BRACR|nr:hypothetical protein DY000_02008289 [Brassica cretica]
MDLCRIDVLGKFGRYIATELGWSSAGARSLRSNRARTARSLCSDRARTRLGRYSLSGAWLVRGPMAILELVRGQFGYVSVAFGQSVFSGSIEIRTRFYRKALLCKLAGFLKTLEYWPRDKFRDLVSGCLILCLEMLETSVLGLGQDLGLITALGGAMTTSTYVSRIVFDLIPSHFKVRDMFSAYVTGMVGIEHLFEDNF